MTIQINLSLRRSDRLNIMACNLGFVCLGAQIVKGIIIDCWSLYSLRWCFKN